MRQIVPGSRACGPARTVRCGQDDNLMVHAAMAEVCAGEVLVLTMPEPAPFALFGDLLATQASERRHGGARGRLSPRRGGPGGAGAAGVGAVHPHPGGDQQAVGEIDVPVVVGGAARSGRASAVVLDGDGIAVVPADDVTTGARRRPRARGGEAAKREQLQAGRLSYDLDGLGGMTDLAPPTRAGPTLA